MPPAPVTRGGRRLDDRRHNAPQPPFKRPALGHLQMGRRGREERVDGVVPAAVAPAERRLHAQLDDAARLGTAAQRVDQVHQRVASEGQRRVQFGPELG